MSEHVRAEIKDGTLAIILDRQERRNAITVAMYTALAEAFEVAVSDANVRLVTIRGEGPDFAAGNDLEDFLKVRPDALSDMPVMRMLRAIATCRKPLVAAVHGNCVGIGTTMLLHCDLVIAADDSRFSMPFVDLALVPEAASSLLFPRLAGRRRSARYLLLCEPFGAEEALEIGLISHAVPAAQLVGSFQEIVRALLAKPAEALRITQKLLRQGNRDEILERMQLEGAQFADRLASDEVKQAIEAFFAKRAVKPAD